jgi:cytochrome c oxidase subunit II
MRRGVLVRLVVFGLAAAAVAFAVAFFVPWLPTPASEEADRIDFVFWFVSVICIAIFALVAAALLYAVMRFRARPDDDSDGAPIHGHTGLEIAWTAVPAVLVTAISVVSAVALAQNDRLPKKHMRVEVFAQQFAWSFAYPAYKGLTSSTLRVPVHMPIELKMRSLDHDVIHSFWVPQFGQKQDLVPGITTRLVITPKRVGSYPVVCTELCGEGHAVMRTQAIVMAPRAFQAWVKSQQATVAKRSRSTGGGAGAAVFQSAGCAGCHTFAAAGSNAATGPALDNLQPAAQRAGRPFEAFVRESIVDPNDYVEKGYQPNIMPSTFDSLPKSQLDALVQFIVKGQK